MITKWPDLAIRVAVLFVVAMVCVHIARLNTLQSISESFSYLGNEDRIDVTSTNSTSYCTDHILKAYNKHNGFYPGEGKWKMLQNGGYAETEFTSNEWYSPALCKLKSRYLFKDELHDCLSKSNIQYIVTIGASNAYFYFEGLQALVEQILNASCKVQKEESGGEFSFDTDSSYFLNANRSKDDLLTKELNQSLMTLNVIGNHTRGCRHCGGMLLKCSYAARGANKTLYLERLPLDHITNSLLNFTQKDPKGNLVEENLNYLRFIMEIYLPLRKPDLFIIFPPLNHEKWRETPERQVEDFQDLFHEVKTNLVEKEPFTKTYWLSGFREVEEKMPDNLKEKLYFGYTGSEQIMHLNKVLFEVIQEDLLHPESRINSFWDMMAVKDKFRSHWELDGAHMLPVWYRKIMGQLLETHCNTVNETRNT